MPGPNFQETRGGFSSGERVERRRRAPDRAAARARGRRARGRERVPRALRGRRAPGELALLRGRLGRHAVRAPLLLGRDGRDEVARVREGHLEVAHAPDAIVEGLRQRPHLGLLQVLGAEAVLVPQVLAILHFVLQI